MTENVLLQGIQFYKDKQYSDALAFFLALPADCGADKMEIAYYLGLCFAKLEKYEDYKKIPVQTVNHWANASCNFLCGKNTP